MSVYFSDDILRGIGARRDPVGRLSVVSNGHRIDVRRRWATGFSVDPEAARHLRGLVELYDGDALLGWCLVYSGSLEGGEHRFEYKRFTASGDAPPVDFVKLPPAALLVADSR